MNTSLETRIDDLLRDDPPRSKSLIVSLLGDAIAPRSHSFWIGTLIDLMAPLGVNARAVRTCVQRLSRDNWLRSERHGRRSRYHLTREGIARIAQASPRIYHGPPATWDGNWLVTFAPPGSLQGWQRAQLRQLLTWEGYRMIGSGLFVNPLGDEATVTEILDELDLQDTVFVFNAESLDARGLRTLNDGIGELWDLDEAAAHYRAFLDRHAPWLEALKRGSNPLNDRQAFIARALVIHGFRRASLHAPRLPAALFPEYWIGRQAFALCTDIYRRTWRPADAYLLACTRDGKEPIGPPEESYFTRFGGLLSTDPAPAV